MSDERRGSVVDRRAIHAPITDISFHAGRIDQDRCARLVQEIKQAAEDEAVTKLIEFICGSNPITAIAAAVIGEEVSK